MQWYDLRQDPRLNLWYARARQRPGWVWKSAALAAAFTIIIPLVLLTFAAIIVGLAVFFVATLIASLASALRHLFNPANAHLQRNASPGRENVRIIDRR